jgi:hypothetical protein
MLPGGFSVGSTTGWLNNTEPEFLRRVAAALRGCFMLAVLTHAHAFQVPREHHAGGVLLPLSQVSAALRQRKSGRSRSADMSRLPVRIFIPNTPTYCISTILPRSQNYEARGQWVALSDTS